VDTDGHPIHISFGLGNNMTVNTILGMPIIIHDLGMIPNFRDCSVTCDNTDATFSICYQETHCGFDAHDTQANTFAALPVAAMYPASQHVKPTLDANTNAPCVHALDDTSNGYL
jgi:hypothetical protein